VYETEDGVTITGDRPSQLVLQSKVEAEVAREEASVEHVLCIAPARTSEVDEAEIRRREVEMWRGKCREGEEVKKGEGKAELRKHLFMTSSGLKSLQLLGFRPAKCGTDVAKRFWRARSFR
jgi:hypothetical protein